MKTYDEFINRVYEELTKEENLEVARHLIAQKYFYFCKYHPKLATRLDGILLKNNFDETVHGELIEVIAEIRGKLYFEYFKLS